MQNIHIRANKVKKESYVP